LHKLITPKNKKIINACIVGEKDRNKKNVLFNLTDNISSSTMNDDFAKNILIREKIRVPTITMEKIFNLCSIKKIDLLKIDIEGAEWGLLETFGKDEYERIKSITIEFHDFIDARFQTQTLNCIERLKLLGYKFISENNAYFGKYFNCLFYKQDE
jgi:FkbM family methyltransferase